MKSRSRFDRRQALLLTAASLAGCVSVRVGDEVAPHAHLRLVDDAPPVPPTGAMLVSALIVQALPADALADTTSIAYSRHSDRFAFYALSSWTERPVRAIPRLLQRRLAASGVAGSVALIGEPLRADWLLTLAIDTLHHDLSANPPRARLAMTLELIDRRVRRAVARQSFAAELTSDGEHAHHGAQAMSRALVQTLDAVVPWLRAALQRGLDMR